MIRYELYTAIALITIILISITWKEELVYRRSLIGIEKSTESKIPLNKNYVEDIEIHKIIPDTTSKGYLGKRKPDGKGWSEEFGQNLLPMPLGS